MKKIKEHQPIINETILEVKMVHNTIEGESMVSWDYPIKKNCYFIIGVLETIKQELLNHIDDEGNISMDVEK